ncbi:hypothetical protein [Mycobacteroides abscessus]|nr:hypothetical protein [Mycobacteroides abscessus]
MTNSRRNREDAVLDAIGALVDDQIARGEDEHQPYCVCGREWHGLPERGCPGTPVVGPGRSVANTPQARAVGHRALEQVDGQALSAGIGANPLPAAGRDEDIENMIAAAYERQYFDNMVSVGRARGPARTLAVVEIDGTPRVLGHLVVADERDQLGVFEFADDVIVNPAGATYELRRLGPDHHSVEQARAINEAQAVQLLLDANLAVSADLLRRSGIGGMLAHYRNFPIPGPLVGPPAG